MSFENAYKYTKKFEGLYVWDKDDSGGETYRGVSRRSNPKWEGWRLVDEAKRVVGRAPAKINAYLAKDPFIGPMVDRLYERGYWEPLGEMPDLVKMKLFDMAVNFGQKRAVIILQQALNTLGAKLALDGVLGKLTRAALDVMVPSDVVEALCKKQADQYRYLAAKNPSQQKFLKGWLARAAWKPLPD